MYRGSEKFKAEYYFLSKIYNIVSTITHWPAGQCTCWYGLVLFYELQLATIPHGPDGGIVNKKKAITKKYLGSLGSPGSYQQAW